MELATLAEGLRDAEPGDARSVLALLVSRAREAGATDGPPRHASEACPNCGRPTPSPRSPYCGDACREEAAFVRQFRASLGNGSLADPERQERLGQALWHVLGGGYPHRLSLIPKSAAKQALKRHEGLCALCGAPATTFDHLGSG